MIFTRVIEQPQGQAKVINTFALCWRALKNIKITYPNITMLQNKEMHLPKEEEKKNYLKNFTLKYNLFYTQNEIHLST